MSDRRLQLVADAHRKGFRVIPNEDDTGWLVVTPTRPRRPSETLGEYANEDRAWMGAALLALEFE